MFKPNSLRGNSKKSVSKAVSIPLGEIVNSLEFEEQAKLSLAADVFSSIKGSDRSVFDKITFRPRMNVSTLDMDLSVKILGQSLFTPIVVGPVSNQGRFHPEGELATVAGAAAAQTVMIVGSDPSKSVTQIAAISSKKGLPFWLSVYADSDGLQRAKVAESVGARAIFATVHASPDLSPDKQLYKKGGMQVDWRRIEMFRKSIAVPLVLKGIVSTVDASRALESGMDGIVVSNFGGLLGGNTTAPVAELKAITTLVDGKIPVLVDGSFRRATDLLAALILGARGILLARPIMWALSAYGVEGVKTLIKMLQTDLARCFAMLGASNIDSLEKKHLRIHRR